jgi:dTDP-glucose 4,6-dehydratase
MTSGHWRATLNLLVTGGAGFIGSHFARYTLERYAQDSVVVLDKLTYAGNLHNLEDLRANPRFRFVRGDIADARAAEEAMADADAVVNFAAETHVDRSLLDAAAFIETDVRGTWTLLEAARARNGLRYLQVSTDEVYGSIDDGAFDEDAPPAPSSPYSASKAGGDLMVGAYHKTYGLDTVITRGSNTYGPYQYPEKLIPLFITNALEDQALPLYGDGAQKRDWLYVLDHVRGIDAALRHGEPGGVYNIGANCERANADVTRAILRHLGARESLITHVADRPGHDRRYAVNTRRIEALGWRAEVAFDAGLAQTVDWYRGHREWWEPLKSGGYADYYARQYGGREAHAA